jgi:hypothetical protein
MFIEGLGGLDKGERVVSRFNGASCRLFIVKNKVEILTCGFKAFHKIK